MNAVLVRGDWVGQVIDGRYPLLEWLGGTGGSGTFLTELDSTGSQRAAIKLVSSSPQAEDRFMSWQAAKKLSHPHLAKIVHCGRTEMGESTAVYLVTDFAEELLSEIVPERPLSPDEARQLVIPMLDVLGYLHNAGFVHGHLKPSNVFVVENEIKLSSDGLIPSGTPAAELLTNDIHVAPEVSTGPVSPRADIWALGVTLVEALSQELPIWDAASDSEPVLPTSIPEPFAKIARECLWRDPSRRCTLAEIRAWIEGKQKVDAPKAAVQQVNERSQDLQGAERPLPARMPFLPLIVGLAVVLAVLIGLNIHRHSNKPTAPPNTEARQSQIPSPSAPPEDSKVASGSANTTPRKPATPFTADGEVVTRDVPDVPRRASNTIHGTVSVIVRLNVDSSGSVSSAEYVTHGPSAYFARLALESARNWKFRPQGANGQALASEWLLHYKFRREGVEVTPTRTSAHE